MKRMPGARLPTDLLAAPLAALAHLQLEPTECDRLGPADGRLSLRRSWPKAEGRLGLEYVDSQGKPVPGQWLADADVLEETWHATQAATGGERARVLCLPERGVLLQAGGADRRLRGLSAVLARPGAELVAHRPEQRAVVRVVTPAATIYVKVVRPGRIGALIERMQVLHELADASFRTPRLLAVDESEGLMEMTALPGQSAYGQFQHPAFVEYVGRAGTLLRLLHSPTPSGYTAEHGPAAEVRVIQRWLARLAMVDAPHIGVMEHLAQGICNRLTDASADGRAVLLHRDYYDKQIVLGEDGREGLLDLDTLAYGERELDVANALVHLELRRLQGRCGANVAGKAARAFLSRYGVESIAGERLAAYADATRLRLACVYSFRPGDIQVVPALVERIGKPVAGLDGSAV